MNTALNELGSQLFGWFGQLSIELAALAVLVLVASRLLPIKSPALRHLLWAIVLLKPLVSIAVSSPYTLFTPFASLLESSQDTLAFSPVEYPTMQVAASPTIATSSVPLTTSGWGAILWIVGAALLIGRILIGYGIVWCLRHQVQVRHDGPLSDALRQARLTLDCYSKVEVAISPSISSPMALGILRPIIVFPADLAKKLSADKLALILMHELAHVRRWDNFTMLLHRLVSAVLFFHPAVWLCGRMLRREAEQACDDLVVCATGRSEAYARGLAHVAERAAHLNPLIRRIPTMNAFAATESDLALRIRRALGGSARRMGTRARVLAAVLLCPLAAVTLPSCGTTHNSAGGDPSVSKAAAESIRDEKLFIVVDQDGNMKLKTDKSVTFATLKEELQAKRQLLDDNTMIIIQGDERSTHEQIAQIMDIARQVGIVDQVVATEPQQAKGQGAAKPSRDDGIWLKAMSTDPDEWSDELKTQLLILKPGSTIEEIAEKIRKRRLWREAKETYPDDWSDELKAQLLTLKTDSLSYEIIAIAESAELVVYSSIGEPVRTFVLGPQNPGKYHIVWDGRDDAGRELGSGVYFYRLKTNPEEASDWRIAGKTMLVR
ncbi:MAG: biopolymer transporter ExbD [Candidatus Latescibacteria bacterium]|nr:biopolymer transporter ExbD [Candidatus Latescibacterota bacterium]